MKANPPHRSPVSPQVETEPSKPAEQAAERDVDASDGAERIPSSVPASQMQPLPEPPEPSGKAAKGKMSGRDVAPSKPSGAFIEGLPIVAAPPAGTLVNEEPDSITSHSISRQPSSTDELGGSELDEEPDLDVDTESSAEMSISEGFSTAMRLGPSRTRDFDNDAEEIDEESVAQFRSVKLKGSRSTPSQKVTDPDERVFLGLPRNPSMMAFSTKRPPTVDFRIHNFNMNKEDLALIGYTGNGNKLPIDLMKATSETDFSMRIQTRNTASCANCSSTNQNLRR